MSGSSDDRFREMFYEEARELLISLEEGLMDLERRQGDRAHLDRTFRAAHSLKGAAAMVGLAMLAEFTHGIEAVLDRIRAGTMAVDSEIITTLLESRDHLAAMVESESAGSPIPASSELTHRLQDLLRNPGPGGPKPGGGGGTSAPPAAPPAPAPPASAPAPPAEPPSQAKAPASKASRKPRTPRKSKKMAAADGELAFSVPGGDDRGLPSYRIHFTPGPDTFRRGITPTGTFEELAELGPIRIETDPEAVPPLHEIDPERCYLGWTIHLETSAELDRIREVFLFFTEDSTVTIERRASEGQWLAVGERPAAVAPSQIAVPPPAAESAPVVEASAPPPASNGAPQPTAAVAAPTLRTPPRTTARIRVDAGQLDDLVGLAGELAVLSDNLMGLRELPAVTQWLHALESLQRVSREIRDTTLDLRMVPVDELFSRFPRVVRDLADRSGKEIELRIVGQETKLDRTIVERLGDPMVHLIRNAVDHALEPPAERLQKGKPRGGRITLSAGHEGDRVAVRVEDDGRGLDRDRIVRKGIALGMVSPGTSPDDPRVVSLIFEPGFSTRDTVSELSGRGVGLDVVRDAVRALRGTVTVESTPGKGTAFIFRLPLTLALIDGLLVETAGGKYVVPLAQVEECVALNGQRSALADDRPCIAVRGELVPMVSLRNLFRADGPLPPRQELLLTRHAGQRVGVAVDRLLGRVQAVIQSLGEGLHDVGRFSGATILGDGSVSLILDLSALVSESRFAEQSARMSPSTGGRAEIIR